MTRGPASSTSANQPLSSSQNSFSNEAVAWSASVAPFFLLGRRGNLFQQPQQPNPQHLNLDRITFARRAGGIIRVRPRSASAFSMSARRLENARSTSFGTPAISPSPLRGTSQESPRVESSARSAEWYRAAGLLPVVELAAVGGAPPSVGAEDHVRDEDVGVELGIAGPAGAMAKCRRPGTRTRRKRPCRLVPVGPHRPRAESWSMTPATARSWATETVSRTSGEPKVHSSDTLLGAEKVRSYPGRRRPGARCRGRSRRRHDRREGSAGRRGPLRR